MEPNVIITMSEYNELQQLREELKKIVESNGVHSVLYVQPAFLGTYRNVLKTLNESEAVSLLHKEVDAQNKQITALENQLRKLAEEKPKKLKNWFNFV